MLGQDVLEIYFNTLDISSIIFPSCKMDIVNRRF